MKMSLLLLLFALPSCHAQDSKTTKNEPKINLSFINNNKIKHAIVMMACRTCAPVSNLGYRVVVTLTEEEQNKIKHVSPEIWLKLLNNDSTDFSANLILYDLYSKDAFILFQNNNKELWNEYLKKEDIEFWNNKFKKQNNATH